jgi:hypothetical protein
MHPTLPLAEAAAKVAARAREALGGAAQESLLGNSFRSSPLKYSPVKEGGTSPTAARKLSLAGAAPGAAVSESASLLNSARAKASPTGLKSVTTL